MNRPKVCGYDSGAGEAERFGGGIVDAILEAKDGVFRIVRIR